MRRRAALAAVLALGLAMAGCGVPDRTAVVVDGRGPALGVPDSSGGEQVPPGPDGTDNNVEEFVNRFLQAPAGDWEGAAERVKRFLSPEQRNAWQPPREITVVRLVNGKPEIKPPPSSEVVLDVQQVGVLTNRGTLEPPTAQTTRYTFTVGQVDDGRPGALSVLNPPKVMLLTDTALQRWYEQRPIYFWDTERRNLVPDLRYMALAVERSARPNVLLGWLLGGPSNWLRNAVLELPEGTEQLQNAYTDNNNRLVVHLSDAATNEELNQLVGQLAWTLRNDLGGEDLILKIETQEVSEASVTDSFNLNPTYRLTRRGAELFSVAGGVVRRAQLNAGVPVPAEIPVLDAAVNKNVRSAAISAHRAALVRTEAGGLRLWVGPTFIPTTLRAGTMSRPVLADGENTGYVAADGKLYQFTGDQAAVSELTVSGLPHGVSAVALAPDGQRLAVVAAGRPYLVALGGGDGTAGAARPLPSRLTNLTGISWLTETGLVMSGTNRGRVALARVTVDGAVELDAVQDVPTSPVTQLVSFPEDPVSRVSGPVMIEADNRAYQVFSTSLQDVQPESLAPPVKGVIPAAPFFLE